MRECVYGAGLLLRDEGDFRQSLLPLILYAYGLSVDLTRFRIGVIGQ